MSSLVTTASPWINEAPSKKRISSIRKTIKVKPDFKPIDEVDDYVSQSENFQNLQNMAPTTIDESQAIQNERNARVNDLLNKITSVDGAEDGKMGEFKPLPNPNYQLKKDMDDNTNIINSRPTYEMPTYTQASNSMKDMDGKFSSNIDNSRMLYSNYNKSYEPAVIKPFYQNVAAAAANGLKPDNKLMEKINYMIHLLEQQQVEKTSNITEEFILYSFLGIFIIFIVDSFAKSGKYTR
uniref:Uncharacterized protein n=1 Tax=viral metagenome TaxID=1070528 RepID=A0A6C0DRQ9_9ZZZZ